MRRPRADMAPGLVCRLCIGSQESLVDCGRDHRMLALRDARKGVVIQ